MAAALACGLFLNGCTGEPAPLPFAPSSSATSATSQVTSPTAVPPTVPTSPTLPTPLATVSATFRELQASLELFSREMLQQGAPAVLIEARSGQQLWSHAAGVRSLEGGVPVQPGDPTRVGALTRTMVAVSVLKLVEEGRVVLDDPVTKYAPEIEGLLSPAGAVSVRQLLGATSGLRTGNGLWGYAVLGILVERVRGARLADVIRTDILEPLELRSTALLGDGPIPENLVHGYARVNGQTVDVTGSALAAGVAAEGVIASVTDVNAFYAALLRGRLLSPASLVEMKGSVFADYGLGLDHWNDRCTNGLYYGHSGDVPGFGTVSISSADGNRQLTISVAYPPVPLSPQPSAMALELTGFAQVALNASCRFQFR